jgi:hypothetical protein
VRVVFTCERGHEQAITFDGSFDLAYVARFAELCQWQANEAPDPQGCGVCRSLGIFSTVTTVVHTDANDLDEHDTADTDRATTNGEEPKE